MGDDGDRHAHRIKRRRLNALDDVDHDRSRDDDDPDRGMNYLTRDHDATTEGDRATEGDGATEDKAVEAVLRKIRKGLSMVVPAEREGKCSQLQAKHTNMVVTKGQHLSTDIIPPDFFAQDADTPGSRSLRLERFLWQQSKTVLRSAKEIAWKSSFLAACLRRNRDLAASTEHKPTIRWTTAVWMINSIVDGLWSIWGPKAALIYEALAGTSGHLLFDIVFDILPVKNYNLSRIVGLSQSMRNNVITRITNTLKDLAPAPLEIDVFHPAAFISTALAIECVISPCRDRLERR